MKPDRGWWSVLSLILVAVLAPTGCILYFMNEAINNQRDIAHQKLAEAYRGQLRLVQQRLDSLWETRAAALELPDGTSPAAFFEHAVQAHLADAVVCLGNDGAPVYPAPPAAPAADPAASRSDWAAARALDTMGRLTEGSWAWLQIADHEQDVNLAGRALQAQIRSMARRGRPGVLRLIEKFQTERLAGARDLQGRSIAADELLLAIRLIPAGDPRRVPAAERLHRLVAGYEDASLPSVQRLFLMDELAGLDLGAGTADFATYDAERLAAQYIEEGRVRAGDGALRLSDVPGFWKLTSPSRRVIALYRESTVMSTNSAILQQIVETVSPPIDGSFGIATPGNGGRHDMVLGGGARLPGWQISMDVRDSAASLGIAKRQRASYVWVGFLVIATLTLTASIAGRAFLRQLRLARLKTDLVATVSHELKTPLASMRLLVDTLLDAPEHSPVQTREYLELIARENARLSRLIGNFLTFSRMERNRAQFDFARTRPEDVIAATIDSIGDRFRVDVNASPDLPAVYADEDALVTVLLNLLENAFKYSAEPRRIELSAYTEEGRCCFAVADNGIGILLKQQKKIFRRFYQIDRRLTRQSGGVGLGLSIVEFIVKAHGGTVRVHSQPGSGSRFVISLPAVAAARGVSA
jgi:signal transduction histidine kinase